MNPPDIRDSEAADWAANYFNYFTDIEEHFQRARGTGLFLLSPLDWALIESWKDAGIPLEAVLKGIDEAFKAWRSRKIKRRLVNSVAYCTQAVMEAAQRISSPSRSASSGEAPFTADELRRYFETASEQLRLRPETPFQEIAHALGTLAAGVEDELGSLEQLELRLTALEDKMAACARMLQSDDDLYAIRQRLNQELKPYRGKMTADQLALLERRYLDTAVLESAKLPRLSLFYLR